MHPAGSESDLRVRRLTEKITRMYTRETHALHWHGHLKFENITGKT